MAQDLYAKNDEWAAVCGFYSCYQLVRASMEKDPIFGDAALLAVVHPNLLPEDRHETKHSKGGLNKPAFGVNEIVTLVYPHIKREYNALHLASCNVRYEAGLPAYSALSSTKTWCELIRQEYKNSNMVHTISVGLKTN
ncbi:hypothetical protein [Arthrobacter sp. 31Cvi3.1E]|uniref:hypothetical protein n=1 Tax=Paenarthrobacter nicotinovorans TaxID=29320 RepID=UPI0009A80357